MAKLISLFCVVLFATQSLGFSFWNDFRVKWGFSPVGNYHQMPRNQDDAVIQGWIKNSGDDCTNGGDFNGFRYMHPNDSGIAILFDVNGFAGGFQSLIPQEEMLVHESTTEWTEIPMYQNHTISGVTYFVITAYFTRPEALCEDSTSNDGHIGTTSQIYFQNGQGIQNLKIAYKHRSDATANGWTVHNCVPGMGWHNFYQVDQYEEHNCNRIQPTCILYNEFDEMFGFCLTYPGMGTSSSHYENPDVAGITAVLGNPPQCLLDQVDLIGATTIHVYFNNVPWQIGC